MTGFATKINNQLSLFALKSEMPIASILPAMSYFGMFIGVLLKLVIVALFILSVIMMNNMLLMSVERKHFDFGLLKIMGAGRVFVIANLLTGSLKYVFYGNIIAYPLAYLSLQIVSNIF